MTGGKRIVVAVTGASGAIYAERLIKAVLEDGHTVDLIVSSYGARLLKAERDLPGEPGKLVDALRQRYDLRIGGDQVTAHANSDLGASLASGSFPVHGMAVVPASMRTVSAVAAGLSATLIDRAASVTLKERRPLVLVPRETPLNRIHLENLLRVHDAGAVVLPADPAFYQEPRSFEDLGDFIAARVMEQLGIPPSADLFPRWGLPD
jgi:4-hydroxy-3-polyprenylbenzoate decarboxylase